MILDVVLTKLLTKARDGPLDNEIIGSSPRDASGPETGDRRSDTGSTFSVDESGGTERQGLDAGDVGPATNARLNTPAIYDGRQPVGLSTPAPCTTNLCPLGR